jgi:hypothetical protein
MIRQQQAAQERRQAKQVKRQDVPQRLPNGARFDVTYDAKTETWSGTLTTTVNGEQVVLRGQKSGVFALLRALDTDYRRYEEGSLALGKSPES